jgi:hypothetical protein
MAERRPDAIETLGTHLEKVGDAMAVMVEHLAMRFGLLDDVLNRAAYAV